MGHDLTTVFVVAMLCVNVTQANVITGHATLAPAGTTASDFNLTWSIEGDTITFTMLSRGLFDWFAFGLHDQVGQGMSNAEVFMCEPQPSNLKDNGIFCQVRNTLGGYTVPAVDKTQYIKLVSGQRLANSATATFSRTLAKASASELSYDIKNESMGVIYARGNWSDGDAMPKGAPLQHTYNGIVANGINFFSGSVTPTPPPKPKIAGVWPDRFDANMTIAGTQLPKNNEIVTSVFARLRYDYPRRRQLWEYFDLKTQKPVASELWIGMIIYYLSADRTQCSHQNLTFDILKPNWLQQTKYISTNYLLRQSFANSCGPVNYTDADLFQIPNTVGMTNSWLVADSKIAEPIRLMGPDNTDKPKTRSILEYMTFEPVTKQFDDSVFTIPKSCDHNAKQGKVLNSFMTAGPLVNHPSGSSVFYNIRKKL